MTLKERIESAYKKRGGFRYHHSTWDAKLWSKSAQEIKEYLLNRFNSTLDEVEYYSCMVLLYHTIPNKTLLIEFKNSSQYLNMYDHKAKENTIKESSQMFKIVKETHGNVRIIGE